MPDPDPDEDETMPHESIPPPLAESDDLSDFLNDDGTIKDSPANAESGDK